MRVLTLNLWGRHGSWPRRRAVLAAGLARLDPDVVAFQEAVAGEGDDQLLELLGPGRHVAHQSVGLVGDGNHAASIASRWPLRHVTDVDLRSAGRSGRYPSGAVVAEIEAPPPVGPVVFAAHGPSFEWYAERDRELQAVAVAREVERRVATGVRHAVVAGDLNAVPDAASIRFWRGLASLEGVSVCYADAWESVHPDDPGPTFDPRNPSTAGDEPGLRRGRRIDYVLVRCAEHGPTLRVVRCELAFDRPERGVWASDHFGVVADLEPV